LPIISYHRYLTSDHPDGITLDATADRG